MSLSIGEPCPTETIVRCTENVPVRAREAYWRETVSIPFPGLAFDWLTNQAIHARLKSQPFADARVTEIVSTPGRVAYTPSLPSASSSYLLVLQLAGNERYAHVGREIIQQPGDLVLLDAARSFDAIFPRRLHILIWHLPRDTLTPLFASPERAVGVRIAGNHGLGAVLAGYARSLVGEVGRFDAAGCPCCRGTRPSPADESGQFDAVMQRSLELHLCSLTALTLGATQAVHETRHLNYRAARRQQIFAYVEAHLRETNLTVERAACDLKMSGRWLQTLLAEGETSFAAWLARRRVEECRKLLDDPGCDYLSITDIAFRSGFNDLSTFNRQFRAHYAMAPRDVRRIRARTRKM